MSRQDLLMSLISNTWSHGFCTLLQHFLFLFFFFFSHPVMLNITVGKNYLNPCNFFLDQRHLCRCSTEHVTAPLAEKLCYSCLWRLCCSISFERLVKSGDNFLSAVSCITTLLLQKALCFDNWLSDPWQTTVLRDRKHVYVSVSLHTLHTALSLDVHRMFLSRC